MCSSEVVADSEATVRERSERREREGTEVINYPEKKTLSELLLLKQQQKNKRGEREV